MATHLKFVLYICIFVLHAMLRYFVVGTTRTKTGTGIYRVSGYVPLYLGTIGTRALSTYILYLNALFLHKIFSLNKNIFFNKKRSHT